MVERVREIVRTGSWMYGGTVSSSLHIVRCNYFEHLEPEGDASGYGVVYLASDESKFVAGSELVIDGGYTAQ